MIVRRFRHAEQPRASVIVLVYAQAEYLDAALRSLLETTDPAFPYEVILVLNGAAPHVAAAARRAARGARIVEAPANLGFGGGSNFGAAHARAPYLVFLNDDVVVRPGWLEELVVTADARPDAGAVGSRILFAGGEQVQEAGSVIFADGSTAPLGRGLPADSPRARAVREVDYCSACSLLVRRAAFEQAGGFERRYFPAYYEDVDLALKLRELGWTILYQPASELLHAESASTTSDFKAYLFRRNHRTLRRTWQRTLGEFEPSRGGDPSALAAAVRRARRARAELLVVDDRVPDAGLGSGYGRLAELFRDLAGGRYAITFSATAGPPGDGAAVGAWGVDVADGDLGALIRDPATRIDVAVISRPHNWERCAATIRKHHPDAALIYDAEALFHRRIRLQLELEADPARRDALQRELEIAYELEGRIARLADHVVCVSADEERALRAFAPRTPIDLLLATTEGVVPSRRAFAQRRPQALFVAGWMAGPGSPNADGLEWFGAEVMPLVTARLPDACAIITGANPPPQVLRLRSPAIRFTGFVDDLQELYASARIAIAPLRFGAGVKIKTIEAVQHGVPVVATPTGVEGIVLDEPGGVVVTEDAARFADAVVALLGDENAWSNAQRAALRQAERWRTAPRRTWRDVVEDVLARRSAARHLA
ncbi:MAG: glycosyltransferase [Candidatus Eremiobacteraeota bacterium]|nr:glycosyltransferase [Candidatus Eremiobacteraeota bacterium]